MGRLIRLNFLPWLRREPASYSPTDELAELMLLPHETVSEYHFSGGPVDCSITVECAVCGRVMCPGCGDAFRVDFGSFQAVVTCMDHAGGVAETPRT